GWSRPSTWLRCPWVESSFCGALSFPLIFPDQVSGFSVLDRSSRTPRGTLVCLPALPHSFTINQHQRLENLSWTKLCFQSQPNLLRSSLSPPVSGRTADERKAVCMRAPDASSDQPFPESDWCGEAFSTVVNYISELQKDPAPIFTIQQHLRSNF
ncbi:unnamed protein product, partial [Tetraodon nigroviridis]